MVKATKQLYVIETRDRMRGAEWTAWVDLTPGTRYERGEIDEFNEGLTKDDFGDRHMCTQWRARLVPSRGGYEGLDLRGPREPDYADEGDPPLSRDMPASVHKLNDELLTALGV